MHAKTYLKLYLKITPLALALQRSVEAKYLSKTKLKDPILDVGCGFGEFAKVFFGKKIDYGVDINRKELDVAQKEGIYRKLLCADAKDIPLSSNLLNTVISISTLEHIKDPQAVLKETFRILKPGGILAFTVITDKWDKNIFFGPLLAKIGLKKLARKYTNLFNRVFKHETILSGNQWEELVRKANFEIVNSEYIVCDKIAMFFDLFLITAWPSQLLKHFFGKRIVFKPDIIISLLANIFEKFIEEEKDGTNYFIVAKKPD